jgi:hypothetical protein
MTPSSRDNAIAVATAAERHPRPIVDVASASVTYYGEAPIGTATSAANWFIYRERTTGTVTTTEYANGRMTSDQVWDNRASLAYSR